MTKICNFPYPIYDLTKKIGFPFYDHRSWHSCPEHSLWRAFFLDGLIDKDGKVAFSKKHSYPIQD